MTLKTAFAIKSHYTIGCCGIDCGLCPRFYTEGDSRCPGCGGPGFKEKHPSCGFITCCVIKNKLEVCSDCADYPCKRFDNEKKGGDSFVTHQKVFANLDFIKEKGILSFMDQQQKRMELLSVLITKYNDGRSKSFYCIACALLPLESLNKAVIDFKKFEDMPTTEKVKWVKDKFMEIAKEFDIELKLNNKTKKP
jgi:hypothetical protein